MGTSLYAYQNTSVDNTLNKSLTEVKIIGAWEGMPQGHDDTNITIRVDAADLTESELQRTNYFALDAQSTGHMHYYYLTSVNRPVAGMYEFNGRLDVLMTYQAAIRKLTVLAARSTSHGDVKLTDDQRRITPVIKRGGAGSTLNPNTDWAANVDNGQGVYVLVTSQSGYSFGESLPGDKDGSSNLIWSAGQRRGFRINTSGVGIYVLTSDELREVFQDLWITDFAEHFQHAFIGDGASSILSLKYFPGVSVSDFNKGSYRCKITLGNTQLINSPEVIVATQEMMEIKIGTVPVTRHFNDFRDWTSVQYKAYFPLVGYIDLNPGDIVGRDLTFSFRLNLTDGSALARVTVSGGAPGDEPVYLGGMVYENAVVYGYDVPFVAEPTRDAWAATIRAATSVVPGAPSGSAPSYNVGTLAPNTGWMGDLRPFVVTYRQEDVTDTKMLASLGAPSAAVLPVSTFRGYLQADTVYATDFTTSTMSTRSYDDVVRILKEGIYL